MVNFDEQTSCLNCGAKLTTPFCGECGQEKARRITFKELIKTAQRALLEFDSPFLHTFMKMTVKPAQVCKDYIEGKRARHFNPIKYAFWSITFLVFLSAFSGQSLADHFTLITEQSSSLRSELSQNLGKLVESSIFFFAFLQAGILALFLKLFFRKTGYNLTELYLLSILPTAHVSWFIAILVVIGQLNTQVGQAISMIIGILFPLYTFTVFFDGNKAKVFLKSSLVKLLTYLCAGILTVLLVGMTLGFPDANDHKTEHVESVHKDETEKQ